MANSKNVCSAVNCNNTRCKCPGLSFFRFPRDPKRFVHYDVCMRRLEYGGLRTQPFAHFDMLVRGQVLSLCEFSTEG
jgi:hypothetical protein